MEPRTSRWNSTTDLPSEPRLVVAILLELIPLFALAIGLVLIAIAAALDLDGPLSTWLLVIIALGVPFFAGGIGWFSIDERQWGWLVLLGRIAAGVLFVVLGVWGVASVFGSALCETAACRAGDRPGVSLVAEWATVAVGLAVVLAPLASAAALALHETRRRIS